MPEVIQSMDATVLLWIQESLRLPLLNECFIIFTHLGDYGLLWIVLSLFMLCIPRTRKIGLVALCSMLLGLLMTNGLLKHLLARPRPYETVLGALPLLIEHDPFSFPSGHTTAAFAATGVWLRGFERRWLGWLSVASAALMGFSRMYVGVHYLSDVLAGLVIGLLSSQLLWMISESIQRRREGGRL